jgi:predicted ATPase
MIGNLPEEFTAFVGRLREQGVRDLLERSRVVTLIGGGWGKTRFALATARDRQRAYPDGVWYIALDGIEEERLLASRVCWSRMSPMQPSFRSGIICGSSV